MFKRDDRIHDVITKRYGTFLSYSASGKSAWVRMDGDITITCQPVSYLLPADSKKIEVSKVEYSLFSGGFAYADRTPNLVFALMANE